MNPKLVLRQAIETLSESECRQLLQLIETWQHHTVSSLSQLTGNPSFRVPSRGLPIFASVTPILGSGNDASQQLIEDRR